MEAIDKYRQLLRKQGWRVLEVPIKSGGQVNTHVSKWKLQAEKGDQTLCIEDKELDRGLARICQMLNLLR
jgi:hypothetical protein